MRCLYCGKELALLKRLRGGGEFCSEAHRQQYQEEYNQLALNRLLQAHQPPPPVQAAAEGDGPPATGETMVAVEEHAPPARIVEQFQASRRPVEDVRPKRVEEPPPAPLHGFLSEKPKANEPPEFACKVQLEQVPNLLPVLPVAAEEPIPFDFNLLRGPEAPEMGGRVRLASARPAGANVVPVVRGVEAKEFSRTPQPIEGILRPEHTFTFEAVVKPLPLEFAALHAPVAGTSVATSAREFSIPGFELGSLAKLALRTIGFVEWPEHFPPAEAAAGSAIDITADKLVEVVEAPVEVFAAVPFVAREPVPIEEPVVEEIAQKPMVEPVIETVREPVAEVISDPLPEPVVATPPPPPDPAPVLQAMAVEAKAAQPGIARLTPVLKPAVPDHSRIEIPLTAKAPLRPLMVLGKSPKPVEAPKPIEVAKVEVPKSEPIKAAEPVKSAETVKPLDQPKPEPKKESPTVAMKPVEPAQAPERLKIAPKSKAESSRPEKVSPESRRVALKPPAPADAAKTSEPVVKASSRPLTPKPVEAPKEPAKEIAKEPVQEAAQEASRPGELPKPLSPALTDLDLGLPTLHLEGAKASAWERLPGVAKLAVAAGLIAAISAVGYFVLTGSASAVPKAAVQDAIVPGQPILDAEWVENWSQDAAKKGRRINLYKTSFPLSDYRIQFDSQIETKAVGWVFRAVDQQNYQVAKLEVIRAGLDPVVALAHYAVIKGQDQEKKSFTLPGKQRVDTLYKVRFEVVGARFTLYLGDDKIAEWSDDRLMSGPPGMMSEKGEAAALRGNVNVIPLVVRKK
jgi:hypothetical protein